MIFTAQDKKLAAARRQRKIRRQQLEPFGMFYGQTRGFASTVGICAAKARKR
jgi:hypothetical protein